MGSRNKEAMGRRKANLERRLEDRLSSLVKKGTESHGIEKDALIKNLRASIKAIDNRLKTIAQNEKRTEELAKIKAEKAAIPTLPKDQGAGKEKPAKKAPGEGKEKAKKKEKGLGQEEEQKPQVEKKQEKKKGQSQEKEKEE